MTAYTGLKNIGKPKEGETLVVAAASGPVGSTVGQIAQINGSRAIGVAGSEDKCRYVVDTLGFDACINHKEPDLTQQLAEQCPNGIDVYFENVGGSAAKTDDEIDIRFHCLHFLMRVALHDAHRQQ